MFWVAVSPPDLSTSIFNEASAMERCLLSMFSASTKIMRIHRMALSSCLYTFYVYGARACLRRAELSAPLFVFWRFLYWRCFGILQSTSFLPSAKLSLIPASRINLRGYRSCSAAPLLCPYYPLSYALKKCGGHQYHPDPGSVWHVQTAE